MKHVVALAVLLAAPVVFAAPGTSSAGRTLQATNKPYSPSGRSTSHDRHARKHRTSSHHHRHRTTAKNHNS